MPGASGGFQKGMNTSISYRNNKERRLIKKKKNKNKKEKNK